MRGARRTTHGRAAAKLRRSEAITIAETRRCSGKGSFDGLKIVVSHGGGYFPHNMGRLDRNVKNAPQSMKNITRKPSEYLRSVHYDTCLFDPSVLSALIKIVGSDRLVLGSDYPVGEPDPVGFVSRCSDIGDAEKRMILGGKAAELVGGVN